MTALTDIYAADVKHKVTVATECRDAIEILCVGPLYPIFLKKLVPVFTKVLEGPPVFISTSWEQVGHYTPRNETSSRHRLISIF